MTVVTARMHRAFGSRAIRPVTFLIHGERIHIGAQHDRFARAHPFENADNTGQRNFFMHVEPEGSQAPGDDTGSARFFKTQFGMHVQIAPGRDDIVDQALRNIDAVWRCNHGRGKVRRGPRGAP